MTLELSGTFLVLASGRYALRRKRRRPAWRPAGIVHLPALAPVSQPHREAPAQHAQEEEECARQCAVFWADLSGKRSPENHPRQRRLPPCKWVTFGSTERRRSRTYPAWGYQTSPVLKASSVSRNHAAHLGYGPLRGPGVARRTTSPNGHPHQVSRDESASTAACTLGSVLIGAASPRSSRSPTGRCSAPERARCRHAGDLRPAQEHVGGDVDRGNRFGVEQDCFRALLDVSSDPGANVAATTRSSRATCGS